MRALHGHHHMALCVAAYGLLVSERRLIPPQATKSCSSRRLAYPPVIDPADPPIRAERHLKASIATIRTKLARRIARRAAVSLLPTSQFMPQ